MSSTTPDRVTMPAGWLWLLRLGGTALGFGLGFAVGPFVRWATSALPFIPGPLKVAAEIPTPWLVPILTVDTDSLIAAHRDTERYIQRSRVGSVFTDPKELVVLDPDGREVFRAPATDIPQNTLAATLDRHGYPWRGTRDPYEAQYGRWIDGHPDLDDHTNALLRRRRRALASNNRADAGELHTQLQDRGIIVRDRDKSQQYRRLARPDKDAPT